jgi:multicomponent Na+:H+ antiporter subunit G
MIIEWARAVAIALLLFLGAGFSLVAALGVFRMPDLYTRMQAAAKTGTLGTGLMLIALAVDFGEPGIAIRSSMVVLFLFLTAPVAAHLIARAGYLTGCRLWANSVCDEMEGRYSRDTKVLAGIDEEENELEDRL